MLLIDQPTPVALRVGTARWFRPRSTDLDEVATWRLDRRVTAIWACIFLNGVSFSDIVTPFGVPRRVGQLIAYGAVFLAVILALSLNRRLVVRLTSVIGVYTVLAIVAFFSTARLLVGFGGFVRCLRLTCFLAVLWLLSPLWGHRKHLLLRAHFRALCAVAVVVLAGLVISPGGAMRGYVGDGRLIGILWPIPPPQVGMYGAYMAGFATILWFCGQLSRTKWWLALGAGLVMIALSQTRTAASGLVLGTGMAALSLWSGKERVRLVLARSLLALPLVGLLGAIVVPIWFTRGQSAEEFSQLTGRTKVWSQIIETQRDPLTTWIGVGLTDKSFNGLSIDNLWFSTFYDLGIVGLALVATLLVILATLVLLRPPSLGRAIGAFFVSYSVLASVTEVGLGDASIYVLHLMVAASVLADPPKVPVERILDGSRT
jgi:O-antigen ligase